MQRPVAFVTGASSGIGEQFARQLARRGHDLVLVARCTERLDALARELEKYDDAACEVLVADLSTDCGRQRALRRLDEGDVDTVVNAAGFGSYGRLVEQSPLSTVSMIECNVVALTEISRAAANRMVARRRGAICNVASIAAYAPGPGSGVYHASKAYVRSFTEALHEEVRHAGVHVTALCPGFTPTGFHRSAGIRAEAVPALATTDAATVARRGLEALARNEAVCVPGALDRVMLACSRLAPEALIRWSTGLVVRHLAVRGA